MKSEKKKQKKKKTYPQMCLRLVFLAWKYIYLIYPNSITLETQILKKALRALLTLWPHFIKVT